MSNRIDFTDRGIIPIYQDVAESNVRSLENFLDAMEAICRKRAYKPLVDFTNRVIKFYEEDFRSHVMSCFDSWQNSDFSLDALAIRCGAGQGAANTGRRYMEELRTNLEGMFRRSFQRVVVDTDAPILEQKDILEANDELNSLKRSAEMIKDNAVSQCSMRSDQNMLYTLIAPVIKNTGESICGSFGSMNIIVEEGAFIFGGGVNDTVGSIHMGSTLEKVDFSWPAYESFI